MTQPEPQREQTSTDQHNDNPPKQGQNIDETGGQGDGVRMYNTIAETVGGVPSLRAKDNLYQGIAILVSLVVGALIGLIWGVFGAMIGAVVGLLVGLFGSGIVLMVLGWVRAARFVQDKTKLPPRQ